MEDLQWMCEKLPEKCSEDCRQWLMEEIYDMGELGENYLLYHRESMEIPPDLKRLMTPEDRQEQRSKRTWGAQCVCACCGEEFQTGYLTGGGIRLYEGEDGLTYPDAWEDTAEAVEFFEGEDVICPICASTCTLIAKKALRHGRTEQVLAAEVQVIEGYMAVLYWMVSRTCDDCGSDFIAALPRDALVVDRDGRVQRFTHSTHGQFGERQEEHWRLSHTLREPMLIRYYSWGAVNQRQVGGWVFNLLPDLAGTTGEKTALETYIRGGGVYPGIYLLFWARHKSVENLLRSGLTRAVMTGINQEVDEILSGGGTRIEATLPWCSWSEVKPNRMLGMDKASFRAIKKEQWTCDWMDAWRLYQAAGGQETAAEFERYLYELGADDVTACIEMTQAGWEGFGLRRVTNYLRKQDMLHRGGVRQLIDYRKALHALGMAETEETLWPRRLIEAHDRTTGQVTGGRKGKVRQEAFDRTYENLKALEWTDGELCIRLPRCEEDLIQEGDTLRHCVGTYGAAHVTGKPIFFVRHYRRPERSYYTLNINMKGLMPKEIQLHGYGNEWHGSHKQHRHTIPQKVRDFCDRWEKEVLRRWAMERHKGKKEDKTA